jgi:hypothetical protein
MYTATDYLPIDYPESLVDGLTVGERGIDRDAPIVTRLLAWVARESDRSKDVRYEMTRPRCHGGIVGRIRYHSAVRSVVPSQLSRSWGVPPADGRERECTATDVACASERADARDLRRESRLLERPEAEAAVSPPIDHPDSEPNSAMSQPS